MQCQVQLRWRRLQILFVPSCISVHHVRHGVEKTNQSLSLMHIDRDWRNGQQRIKCTLSSFLNTYKMLTWGHGFHIRCNIKVMEKPTKNGVSLWSNIYFDQNLRLQSLGQIVYIYYKYLCCLHSLKKFTRLKWSHF